MTDVHICKPDYCYNTFLILAKNLTSTLILGQPFVSQLYPFIVTEQGIITKVLNKEIFFKFTDPIVSTELNTLNNKLIKQII